MKRPPWSLRHNVTHNVSHSRRRLPAGDAGWIPRRRHHVGCRSMPADKTRRKAHTKERRATAERQILEGFEALLADRPFRDLTVEDVMANAGLSRTTFY